MILGRPSGSARMPAVTIDVPPPPPMPMMPAMSSRVAMKRAKAAAMAATAAPRSLDAERVAGAVGMMRRDFGCGDIRPRWSARVVPTSTQHRRAAGGRDPLGEKGEFLALGVGGADDVDPLHVSSPRSARRAQPSACRFEGERRRHCSFLRRAYRIDMARLTSTKPALESTSRERGPRARTGRLMLETAIRLMQAGATPSVSEVAEAAGVSRATAYRYFPSQAALVQAVVDEGLGPILTWTSDVARCRAAASPICSTQSMPRIEAFEATFKAALKLSLDQWARGQAGTLGDEPQFKRGHRVDLLQDAHRAAARARCRRHSFERLAQALSLVFGVEVLIVLKDIWGLDGQETQSVAQWAARALVACRVGKRMQTRS